LHDVLVLPINEKYEERHIEFLADSIRAKPLRLFVLNRPYSGCLEGNQYGFCQTVAAKAEGKSRLKRAQNFLPATTP